MFYKNCIQIIDTNPIDQAKPAGTIQTEYDGSMGMYDYNVVDTIVGCIITGFSLKMKNDDEYSFVNEVVRTRRTLYDRS